MTKRLEGKTAVITAAGQGIGRAIAEAFVSEGARVYASDIDPSKLEGLGCAQHQKLDVRNELHVTDYIGNIETIDILVNCAGYVHQGTILECDMTAFDVTFDVNVRGMHNTMRSSLPRMVARNKGAIINIASIVSSLKGVPERYVYAGSKGAVIGLTKAVAADFARFGIRANSICPGTIETPSLADRVAKSASRTDASNEDALSAYAGRQALGRLGTAAEIAHLAVYLGSDESSFTTGQNHIIDGGWMM